MNEIVVTYETLYELLRRERDRAELQELPQTFLNDVEQYIQDKEQLASQLPANALNPHRKQLDNTNRIIRQIMEQREKKIIHLALDSIRTNNSPEKSALLSHEQLLLSTVLQALQTFRTQLGSSESPATMTAPAEPKPTVDMTVVKFLESVPKFVGPELEEYGPYSENETATLPKSVAEVLLDNSRAQLVQN